jgi:hypothetical protein
MRKLGSLLVAALIILLAACGERLPAARETSVPPSPSVSATAEKTVQTVILPNGPLPQSAYTPPSQPPRFYADITHALIPRDDYGRIWPYVGGFAAQWYMTGDLIGLCDAKGRVICDPVFSRAEVLEKDGQQLYKLTKNLADAVGKEISKITLIRTDGSWAKEYDGIAYASGDVEFMEGGAFVWRQRIQYEYISVCENGRWGVIDYTGTEVLPCVYKEPVCFSEGLAAVTSDDGDSISFIDRTGTVLLGPYSAPPQQSDEWDYTGKQLPRNHGMLFSEGLVRFFANGRYGVIDKTGRIVIPAQYDFITSFRKGTAMIITREADAFLRGVIDSAGRVLYAPADVWFSHSPDGTVILDTPQGQMALDPETGVQTPWENKDPAAGASYSQSSDGVVIYWGDETQSFPDATNVVFLDNGNLALSNRGSETWYIADRSGKLLTGPFEGRADYIVNGFIYVSAGMSGMRDGTDSTYYTLYDMEGNRVLPELYREIIPIDGRYLVRQDSCAGLLDEQGNWVLKTPIYDYLND